VNAGAGKAGRASEMRGSFGLIADPDNVIARPWRAITPSANAGEMHEKHSKDNDRRRFCRGVLGFSAGATASGHARGRNGHRHG
jgi:hypothetical protein